ncbi:pathogenicity island protein [Macrococcus epidermidis]|uniref:pathogenicity island protein n=1 Tax=Macrococcus epidermidis TaxID=1902580 RepID=UPI0020B648CC|nr:pathogenicity island protein [Macrococcus epidermidis]UTH16970.1 pathogenicity island protein [Macrococcus epidermidis]
MKLIRFTSTHIYTPYNKITEYELLRDYSPNSIKLKIAFMNMQINEMYHLSVSHTTTSDTFGIITVGCKVEALALWIIEQKESLERYKVKSNTNMQILKECLKYYSKIEQRDIKRYLISNGNYGRVDLIEQLRKDIFEYRLKGYLERDTEQVKAEDIKPNGKCLIAV